VAIAIVFPGQGTQQPGMGEPWRDHPAWRVVDDAEAAFGEPLAHLVLTAGADDLARTREAQLAVLLTSLVAWEAVRTRVDTPVAFAGHSLGQVTALIAAGVLSLADGVRFAARRAELTQAAADAHPGRMAALLGASVEQAEEACAAAPGACWVANDNAPGQVVVSGHRAAVERAVELAKAKGARRAVLLPVSAPFHCALMQPAADAMREALAAVAMKPPAVALIANVTAAPASDPAAIRDNLVRQVTGTVRWRECVGYLAGENVATIAELGAGKVLTGLNKRMAPNARCLSVGTPDEIAQAAEALRKPA